MYKTHILKNGLKIIHQYKPNKAAYCGVIIGVGTRDERSGEYGVAHFLEHVLFKGTAKRKAYHILSRLEDVGGELNAYTTKEDTCVYSTFLSNDYERVIELFSDILFNSVFPEKEIEKEKDVVVEEINSYKDSPDELIFDDFEELVYAGYPIGRNILGSESDVRQISREKLLDFVRRRYNPRNMVLSSIGDIDFDKLVSMVEKYFGEYENSEVRVLRRHPKIYKPTTKKVVMDTYQTHCIIGNVAYDYNNEKRLALSMLSDILGGAGMNSRLNMAIREKHGYAYTVESSYTPYSDTGLFTIYVGCDKANLDKCIKLCRIEMQNICSSPMGEMQLRKAKTQMIGQLTISSENYESMMLSIGKSFLVYDKIDDMDYIFKKINEINSDMLLDVAKEILDFNKQSILIYE